jgi:hypothetical protein
MKGTEDNQKNIDELYRQLQSFHQDLHQKCFVIDKLEEELRSLRFEISTIKETHVSHSMFLLQSLGFGMIILINFFHNTRYWTILIA